MSSATLNHPKLQVSVQQFFKGVSWTGQLAPAEAKLGADRTAAIIQTFHPTSETTSGESLSLMRSVRGFMNNIPWTGGVAPVSQTPTARSAPANLDAFSDFF
jgi:hypothetical protein